MGPRIQLEDAAFSYGDQSIFRHLSLDLRQGQILCLLGPNGCGKTTLLRCASGLAPLQEGRVLVDGKDMALLGEVERAKIIGFVFQEHHVLFPYTVLDVVRMGRAPHLGLFAVPSRRDTQVADEAIETVGISELRLKRYTEISGGERQLALIARALAQEPTILLLDEPTSHLDFGNQTLILETIKRLTSQHGLAVLMATHVPDHALFIASQVALMKAGGFLARGTPQEVVTEKNLKALYGIDVRIVAVSGADGAATVHSAVPLLRVFDSTGRAPAQSDGSTGKENEGHERQV
jgi:ABC-type cobalamin/Fe3+-siderophores transport system ATPase subunit